MTMNREQISDHIAGLVNDDDQVQDYCHGKAIEESGASLEDMDEDNKKGQAFWAAYSFELVTIMTKATLKNCTDQGQDKKEP